LLSFPLLPMSARNNPDTVPRAPRRTRVLSGPLLNAGIALLAIVVAYLGYSFVVRTWFSPPVDPLREDDPRRKPIQVDVWNGCGQVRAASTMTAYLRARGYDIVELRNYHRFDVRESLVVDRTGRRENAEKVARALGIPAGRIIQQLNPDEFVDVSIVIGQDYASLKSSP
jgi:hypothetical protein